MVLLRRFWPSLLGGDQGFQSGSGTLSVSVAGKILRTGQSLGAAQSLSPFPSWAVGTSRLLLGRSCSDLNECWHGRVPHP